MSINGKSTQIKVIIGYILFILLLFFSINYIYNKIKVLTQNDGYEQQLNDQRRVTYLFLTELYQTEIIGQSVSAGLVNDYQSYSKSMANTLTAIDSLQKILSDTLQIARLDTMATLLKQKQQNMLQLIRALKEADAAQIYNQKIETVIQQQDTLVHQLPQIQKIITVQEESYVVKTKEKSSFFKRLIDAFSSPKEDSTIVTNTKQEIVTDSLVRDYNPADTVTTILRTIQTQVNDSILNIQNSIQRRIQRFRRNGFELSTRINQLLQAFEEAEQLHSENKIALEQNIYKKSVRIIGIVAIIAIILVAVFLFMIERDITRSYHYRKELEKAKKRAEDLLVAREKLMLTITHDIKAPVGSILGYIDLLTRLIKDERQQFYLQNMKSSAGHLLDLVSSLLDFHRLESHKMEINQVPFNPYQLFETIQISFRPLAEKKNLQLVYQPDKQTDRFFLGDPFRIRQIAENLLSNALKFTKEGTITFSTQWTNQQFCFTVEDTGDGISETDQKNMFQEFTRLKNAQGEEGFGLGLAITKRMVKLMKGHIQLESKVGTGSTFTVCLPLQPTTKHTPSTPTNLSSLPPATKVLPANQKLHLIFIDDDRIQLELTRAMLQHPQLDIHCCETPEHLLQLLNQRKYDILFTDIQMPTMNGFELVKQLQTTLSGSNRNIPIIALTARSEMNQEQFQSQGFKGYLHKPYTQKEVLDVICTITGYRISNIQQAESIDIPKPQQQPTFNFAAITAFSGDDPDAAKEILESFVSETQHNRECLAEALRQQDCQQIRAISHKQLPLFTMLGMHECLPILTWLEQENYTSLNDNIVKKVTYVIRQMQQAIEEAKKLL